MGEDRLHLFVSCCTVQVAALYANRELIENYYNKSSGEARTYHGAFCVSRAMSLSDPGALFFCRLVRERQQGNGGAYARVIITSLREVFRSRLSRWTHDNPNVTVIPGWPSPNSALRYATDVANDATIISPPNLQLDTSTDSFVHNWQKVAQSVRGSAG
ncbi:hypothetical protein HPB52_017799 [Rhipicephalus sanguineus]|uniref:Uncharacterized protein n=1 Tax=Rhipicephalus sanguineus TaxID=34632 RepID=A0A9D4PS51_RHISA|nr:hypothetical protein HPB52_017799 [Rhipicephalus sanguineus]